MALEKQKSFQSSKRLEALKFIARNINFSNP